MDKRTEAQRREPFREVNASCAVEDRVMTVEDLAPQERVICGQITHEGAVVAEMRKESGLEAPAALGKGAKPRRRASPLTSSVPDTGLTGSETRSFCRLRRQKSTVLSND